MYYLYTIMYYLYTIMYYLYTNMYSLNTGDKLHARCVYVNEHDTKVLIGSTASDEMCNFYLMYYQTASKFR